jgi:hypothetical protein
MTFILKDIRDRLETSTNIANEFGERIYADTAPQNAVYPFILLSDLSAQPEYYLEGEVGTHTSQIQVDVWTDGTGGKQKANELGELVRNRLSGYRGTIGGEEGAYGTIRMIRNDSTAPPPLEGSSEHRRRVSMDFEIIHSADVPTLT